MQTAIEIGIPLFAHLDDFEGVVIERVEVDGTTRRQWGALVKDGDSGGAYYFTLDHPSTWDVDKCAWAIQSAADHRYMMEGPPGTWTKEDVFKTAEILADLLADTEGGAE